MCKQPGHGLAHEWCGFTSCGGRSFFLIRSQNPREDNIYTARRRQGYKAGDCGKGMKAQDEGRRVLKAQGVTCS